MADAVAHRGPDDVGVWLDEGAGIALGHRRLAILDLSPAGHQPMTSDSGRYVIAFNGEIYNFREIQTELGERNSGRHWRGGSDTEVLLAAISYWGVRDTLSRLNGMFAFAVWDRDTRTLTLARDRMGEKPLYYGTSRGIFLFGSELKALRAHPEFESSLDLDALTSMLRYDYITAPHSIWNGISKLQAGHYLEITSGGQCIGIQTPYWSLADCAILGSARPLIEGPELVSQLESLLTDAVSKRMVADVPVGAFLSGGIDSSLIVAVMQAQSSRPTQTFTIGFEDRQFDEAPQAKAVAAHLGTQHTELYVTAKDAFDIIPRLPTIWDEPFGDSSQIPTYLVSALSRRSVAVVLSGDGADELFGGYSRFQEMGRAWESLRHLPMPARSWLAHLIGIGSRNASVPGVIGRAANILHSGEFEALYRWRVSRVEHPESLVLGNSHESSSSFGSIPFLSKPGEKMLYADTLTYLPEDILTKVDRASMAVGLEARAPFLDHRIVEFSWKLPMSQKLRGDTGKAILRSLGSSYLPSEVMNRPKQGFCLPVASWLRGPLRSWAEDLLGEQSLSRQAILNVPAVRALWHDHLSGKRRHERILWNLLMFQAWLEEVDHRPDRSSTPELFSGEIRSSHSPAYSQDKLGSEALSGLP
jgi:asparagine synthase (glutamine-hydrolysing)